MTMPETENKELAGWRKNLVLVLQKIFFKEHREIGVFEDIVRTIASGIAFLVGGASLLLCVCYALALLCVDDFGEDALKVHTMGVLSFFVGLVTIYLAYMLSVFGVCPKCHLNRGVQKVAKNLVEAGEWKVKGFEKDKETSLELTVFQKIDVYEEIYQCEECGHTYSKTVNETFTKKKL